jgi:hypothetical protein
VSSVEQIAENMKIGAIVGAEYRKMKTGGSTDDTSFYVFDILLHRWHQFSCFRCSAPLMTPVFICGAEYQKQENWCHQWSRVPKS